MNERERQAWVDGRIVSFETMANMLPRELRLQSLGSDRIVFEGRAYFVMSNHAGFYWEPECGAQ